MSVGVPDHGQRRRIAWGVATELPNVSMPLEYASCVRCKHDGECLFAKRIRSCSALIAEFFNRYFENNLFFRFCWRRARPVQTCVFPVLRLIFCFVSLMSSLANGCDSRVLAMPGLPSGDSDASQRRCRRLLFGQLHNSIFKEDGVV